MSGAEVNTLSPAATQVTGPRTAKLCGAGDHGAVTLALMTWIAPHIDRRDLPTAAAEREMLQGWLDWHRDTLLTKCAGLTPEQLAEASTPPSTLTLLGLVRHMTDVERVWFRQRFAGEQVDARYFTDENADADLDDIDPAGAEAAFAAFRAEIEVCDAAVAGPRPGRALPQPPRRPAS